MKIILFLVNQIASNGRNFLLFEKKKLYFNRINQTGPKLSNELVNVYKIR